MSYHPCDPEADRLAVEYRDRLTAECRKEVVTSRAALRAYCDRLATLGFTSPQMLAAVKTIEADVVLIRKADFTLGKE